MTPSSETVETSLSLKEAFESELARRETDRLAREAAMRQQQEADLAGARQLLAAVTADPEFLGRRGLTADQRRYTVSLDHARFRISAYFESGAISVTQGDKRDAAAASLRRQETVHSLPDALRLIAQFLVEEMP